MKYKLAKEGFLYATPNGKVKLAIIDKVYKELSDPKHPISQAMFRMEAVEEVRIIEGKV